MPTDSTPDPAIAAVPSSWSGVLRDAAGVGENIGAALQIARRVGAALPAPGSGATVTRWSVLAELGRAGAVVARVVEPHVDALAILAEAGGRRASDDGCCWGVFAAEGPGQKLTASAGSPAGVTISGVKPWCSLAGELDRALITAWDGDRRSLYRVDLRQRGVTVHPADGWVARGLRPVVSVPVSFAGVPAEVVGAPGWYLRRAGFAWGGVGVAACWHGIAVGLYDEVLGAARDDDLAAFQVGSIDAALHASRAVLLDAAAAIDQGAADGARLAARCRAVVADTAERVLALAGHVLGPGRLAFDEGVAGRVADLTLYVRQHHGERDLATLGRTLLADRG